MATTAADREDSGSRHHAFISYSHRDEARVERLHREIVRFGLPPWRRGRGGVPFTKDAVCLMGVLEVDALLRIAIRDNRPSHRRVRGGTPAAPRGGRRRRLISAGAVGSGWAGPLRHRSRAVVRGSFLGNDLSDIMAPK